MGTVFKRFRPTRERREYIKNKVLPVVSLVFVVLIAVVIVLYHDRIAQMGYYGYPSVLLVSMLWNSTIIYPIPSFWIYYPLGSVFFPPLLALAGGAGAAVGELTGYMAGYSGRGLLKKAKGYHRAECWVKRWGSIVIFFFNLIPFFPYDLAGMAAGALRFPLWKFFLLCLAGRSTAYFVVAAVGAGWIQLPAWLPLPALDPPQ